VHLVPKIQIRIVMEKEVTIHEKGERCLSYRALAVRRERRARTVEVKRSRARHRLRLTRARRVARSQWLALRLLLIGIRVQGQTNKVHRVRVVLMPHQTMSMKQASSFKGN
jgi:hypothetical protein